MTKCTEFAVFQVNKENIEKAVTLSQAIFSEMNEKEEVIIDFQILKKTDKAEELCWHITWVSADAAKSTTEQWPNFSSTKAFQKLVEKDLYYGHFVSMI